MEKVIADLLTDFEAGRMNRRQLIQPGHRDGEG
jgi:hypothetical protein